MLDPRKKKMLTLLLRESAYTSTESLGRQLDCSEKTVRNDLKRIDEWLQANEPDVEIGRKAGSGVWLQADSFQRERLRKRLETMPDDVSPVDEQSEKMQVIRFLLESEGPVTLQQLAAQFYMSRTAVRQVLSAAEKWLKPFGLVLVKKPHLGVMIEGNEKQMRLALSKVFEQRTEKGGGLSALVRNLNGELEGVADQPHLALIESHIRQLEPALGFRFTEQSVVNMLIHIAIALKRIKLNRKIEMPPEELRRLQSKPEYEVAAGLAAQLERAFAVKIPEAEVGYLTLHLLGAKLHFRINEHGLREVIENIDAEALSVAGQFIDKAAQYVEEQLKKDQQLLMGLAIHLHSAINRLRNGLTLTNPMKREIQQTYRHIFELIYSFIPEIEEQVGVVFPEEEVAYLTLHIQAALERLKDERRLKRRVLVV